MYPTPHPSTLTPLKRRTTRARARFRGLTPVTARGEGVVERNAELLFLCSEIDRGAAWRLEQAACLQSQIERDTGFQVTTQRPGKAVPRKAPPPKKRRKTKAHPKTKHDLSKYLHACAFSPNPSTLLRSVKRGHFDSWPNLSPTLITKHLPKSLATSKGHMRM